MNDANVYTLLEAHFPPDRSTVCLETPDGAVWTWADVEATSARYAGLMRERGVEAGDRVAVQVEKSPRALVLYLACLRAGAVYLPLNPAYPERELDYFLGDAEPRMVVARPELLNVVAGLCERHGIGEPLTLGTHEDGTLVEASRSMPDRFDTVERGPDDLAALLYTSGTTGKPKGAMLTHANLFSNAQVLHEAWGFRARDVLLHMLPIFHTHGLFVACHTSLLNGTPMIFCPRFDAAEACRLLPRATVFMGVPTYYVRLLGEAGFGTEQCSNVRLFVSGSAPLLEQTFEEFRERTGHTILERYGMTECGMSTSNPLDGERRAGTVGLPLAGVDLRVAGDDGAPAGPGEVGGIEFKGPNVFSGYWRMPEKTAEEFTADGYFRSGDLGWISEDGYIAIVGRGKDLIISGGLNVYPKEVELLIDKLDGVMESAVIGLPHPDFGEQVTAVVVREAGATRPTEQSVIGTLKADLAGFKVPKQVFFADELPRNSMGKVQKSVLRERLAR
ncbi:MAG: malonyl-CoA synthase [Gammaproteobacteria bacterium]|nr:malonyl-CoA synthase [Gammaproteobacteria bacterium]